MKNLNEYIIEKCKGEECKEEEVCPKCGNKKSECTCEEDAKKAEEEKKEEEKKDEE